MANETRNLIVGLVVLWLVFGQAGEPAAPIQPGVAPGVTGCAYAPTFQLRAADKWDTGVVVDVGHSYQLNGGTTATYAGSAISANLNDKLDVMFGAANATIYNEVESFKIDTCGLNLFPKTGNKLLIQNTSFTVQCFNEEGNLIDDSTENETITNGDTVSIDCEIRGVSKKGMPHGGVLVLELPTTYYDEEDTVITGLGASTAVPSKYQVSNVALKALAWDVDAIMGSGKVSFTVDLQADATNDPLSAATTGDIFLDLYSKDCYENSDTGKYECGVVTEDATWAGDLVGEETLQVD